MGRSPARWGGSATSRAWWRGWSTTRPRGSATSPRCSPRWRCRRCPTAPRSRARSSNVQADLPSDSGAASAGALGEIARFSTLITTELVPLLQSTVAVARSVEALTRAEFRCPPDPATAPPPPPPPPPGQEPGSPGAGRLAAAQASAAQVDTVLAALPSPLTAASLIERVIGFTTIANRNDFIGLTIPILDDVFQPLQTLAQWAAMTEAEVGANLRASLLLLRDRLRAAGARSAGRRLGPGDGARDAAPRDRARDLRDQLPRRRPGDGGGARGGRHRHRRPARRRPRRGRGELRDPARHDGGRLHRARRPRRPPAGRGARPDARRAPAPRHAARDGGPRRGPRRPRPAPGGAARGGGRAPGGVRPHARLPRRISPRSSTSAPSRARWRASPPRRRASPTRSTPRWPTWCATSAPPSPRWRRRSPGSASMRSRPRCAPASPRRATRSATRSATASPPCATRSPRRCRRCRTRSTRSISPRSRRRSPTSSPPSPASCRTPPSPGAIEEIRALLDEVSTTLRELSFAPATDQVIALIEEMTKGLRALTDTDLNDALKGAITAALSVLPPDLRPVTEPLIDEFGVAIDQGPVVLLEAIRSKPQEVLDRIREFDPGALVGAALSGPFREATGKLDGFRPSALIAPLGAALDAEKARLKASAKPSVALQPAGHGLRRAPGADRPPLARRPDRADRGGDRAGDPRRGGSLAGGRDLRRDQRRLRDDPERARPHGRDRRHARPPCRCARQRSPTTTRRSTPGATRSSPRWTRSRTQARSPRR